MLRDKTILITGGCGFIGSALAEYYHNDNKITAFDICEYIGSPLHMRNLNMENITVIQGDSRDKDIILNLGNDFDYIIHASAVLGIRKVAIESILTMMTNVDSTVNTLELAKKQNNLIKYLTFSTSEVYGKTAVDSTEESEIVIGNPKESRWCYAASKALSEQMVFAYEKERGLRTAIIRPCNVYGEYRLGTNAFTTFVSKALCNEDIYVDGNGNQVRTWCHIDDFVGGCAAVLESDVHGEIFNIGNPDTGLTIYELAKKIVEATNSQSKIIVTNSTEPDVKHRVISVEKICRLGGYTPTVTLDEGIRKVSAWMEKYMTGVR